MTNEELIDELIRHKQETQNDFGWNITLQEALDMAIEELKAEPCEDAVSREAVLACEEHIWDDCGVVSVEDIKALPPVTPKPKTAQWVVDKNLYKCTACNELCTVAGYASCISEEQMYKMFKHCPNCGAKMERVVSK